MSFDSEVQFVMVLPRLWPTCGCSAQCVLAHNCLTLILSRLKLQWMLMNTHKTNKSQKQTLTLTNLWSVLHSCVRTKHCRFTGSHYFLLGFTDYQFTGLHDDTCGVAAASWQSTACGGMGSSPCWLTHRVTLLICQWLIWVTWLTPMINMYPLTRLSKVLDSSSLLIIQLTDKLAMKELSSAWWNIIDHTVNQKVGDVAVMSPVDVSPNSCRKSSSRPTWFAADWPSGALWSNSASPQTSHHTPGWGHHHSGHMTGNKNRKHGSEGRSWSLSCNCSNELQGTHWPPAAPESLRWSSSVSPKHLSAPGQTATR